MRFELENVIATFHRPLAGINDVIGFHGESVSELESAFQEAVEDYLETCKKTGSSSSKNLFWQYHIRIPPEMHAN